MPGPDDCATIVRRDDPRLWKTALFAPEPARSRLMVLYAFDIELSRAVRASGESLIPRMRLQWWRDVVDDATRGAAPKAHEVAGPLANLIGAVPALGANVALLLRLIDAREQELAAHGGPPDRVGWSRHRFQSLVRLAAGLSVAAADGEMRNVPQLGTPLGNAYLLRHLHKAAATGRAMMLGDLGGPDIGALARGELTGNVRDAVGRCAADGLADLGRARGAGQVIDRRAIPALLPVFFAERTLRLAVKDPAAIFGQLDDIDRPFDGLRLAWRAVRGRW